MLFDFAALGPAEHYKLLAATVVPRPIAWVVTSSPAGVLNAAPYSFFNVLSGDPPIVAFGISRSADRDVKDTADNIRRNGQFVVNLVDTAQAEAMNLTAADFPAEVDEIAAAGLSVLPSTHVAPPRIAGSPVALECERFTTLEFGIERSIVLGRVLAMHVADEAVMDPARCYIDTRRLDLIGRMGGAGSYVRLTDHLEIKRVGPGGKG